MIPNDLNITIFCPVFIGYHASADGASVQMLAGCLICKVKNGKIIPYKLWGYYFAGSEYNS